MLKKLFLSAVLCTASMVAMAQSQIITHVVQRGETLESIAKYYNISVADLNNANPNADGIIYVGMKLAVPVMAAATTTTSTVASEMATNLSETSNTLIVLLTTIWDFNSQGQRLHTYFLLSLRNPNEIIIEHVIIFFSILNVSMFLNTISISVSDWDIWDKAVSVQTGLTGTIHSFNQVSII